MTGLPLVSRESPVLEECQPEGSVILLPNLCTSTLQFRGCQSYLGDLETMSNLICFITPQVSAKHSLCKLGESAFSYLVKSSLCYSTVTGFAVDVL